MPTYATITDTDKAGFITVLTNDLHAAGATPVVRRDIRKSTIEDLVKIDKNGDIFIEIISMVHRSLYTCNLTGANGHFPVTSVNGETPADMDDLYTKLLALL